MTTIRVSGDKLIQMLAHEAVEGDGPFTVCMGCGDMMQETEAEKEWIRVVFPERMGGINAQFCSGACVVKFMQTQYQRKVDQPSYLFRIP